MIDAAVGKSQPHASLLPKCRGRRRPVGRARRKRNRRHRTNRRRSRYRNILLQKEIPIQPQDTAVTLAPRMAATGADLMVETLRRLQSGTVHPQPQDHAKATLAPILKKEDGKIDFQNTAQEILNRLRGFQPWPGAYTSFRGKNLHIWAAQPIERAVATAELLVESGSLIAGCGEGSALQLLEVQLEGKKRMPAADFVGYQPTGEVSETENRELVAILSLEYPCPLPARVTAFDVLLELNSRMPMLRTVALESAFEVIARGPRTGHRIGHGSTTMAIAAGCRDQPILEQKHRQTRSRSVDGAAAGVISTAVS